MKKIKFDSSLTLSRTVFVYFLFSIMIFQPVIAQTEVMAWGNLTGIRVEGQLMDFETSLQVVGKNWSVINATGKEKQSRPSYHRDGITQTVTTDFGGFQFSEIVKENGTGSAIVSVTAKAVKDTIIDGVYFCIDLPEKYYGNATVRLNGSGKRQLLSGLVSSAEKNRKLSTKSIIAESEKRQLSISIDGVSPVIIRKEKTALGYRMYIGIMGPDIKKDQQVQRSFTIKATGEIDKTPVEIVVDAQNPGRRFAGFGGNFRLQNPKTDPQVIQYCLNNMRVAWGRVEMPWGMWHPDENTNPIEAAKAGKLNQHVQESMLMAQKLAKTGMPIIISDWSAPDWAIIGDPRDAFRNRSKGIYGYPLNPEKTEKIYQSIGDYLVYLKQNYGVEPKLFSFNESDLGINIRHTGKEHAEFIKGFGAHLASRGIATKLLLGDNSDATTFDFILPAMNDPETHKYIGAVSFHSWRGCDDETLKKWASAAKKMNLPLIVAEGSTDAAAWTYPEIFYEQTFALYEINLYIRICSICQPLTILQWQLTSDYSVLMGDGIFRTEGPLRPTRRFWDLKQLASTHEDAFALPANCNKEEVNCAVFGNLARGEYAVHIVNNGAERPAEIKGIPADVTLMEIYVTDTTRGMEKTGEVKATDGSFKLNLPPAAMITLKTM
jgi:O-glycosyl hydrolase